MKNKWSLVIHEATETSVNLWIGTLFHDLRKPKEVRVTLFEGTNQIAEQIILSNDWLRPFSQIKSQRFYKLLSFSNLEAGRQYKVSVAERFVDEGDEQLISLTNGLFWTLPSSVNDLAEGFTLAVGSCYYEEYDGGQVSTSYETLSRSPFEKFKPHIKFLTGDQVYLDIGWDSLSIIPKEIRDRIANDYALHWQALRGMHRNGGTWFVADDHEFWNNYPFVQGFSPFIQALRLRKVKNAWVKTAKDGVLNVQRTAPVKSFSIGNDVSFCVVDLRAFRSKSRILPEKDMQQLCEWLSSLSSPGILVLSQPLMEEKGDDGDKNFVSYENDYKRVIKAINDCAHDVLVLSGDVHHGRVSTVNFAGRDNKLHEVVSSPLSNLSGISAIATSYITKKSRLKNFPPYPIDGVSTTPIEYGDPWRITSTQQLFDFRYIKRRTKEHFLTLNLKKNESGALQVEIRAWLVREQDKKTGLPKQDWKKPVIFNLK